MSWACATSTSADMSKICWPYFDPDFDGLLERIHGPACRVCIDNESMEDCTVVKVDSVKNQGLLLEVVQILTDLNLTISKGYISSDARWFMDVFYVKDEHGNKLTDQKVINYIKQGISGARGTTNTAKAKACANKVFRPEQQNAHTAIEIIGTDRPGLFSEISAALAGLHCNIVEAHAWSHNDRLACVAYLSDQTADSPIDDPDRLATIEAHLTMVLRANTNLSTRGNRTNQQEVKTAGFMGGSEDGTMTNVERRLHQLMISVRDFERPSGNTRFPATVETGSEENEEEGRKTTVIIESCDEKGYSIVTIDCKDRPRLMFDTVCTLTDLQYVIFHACITSGEGDAFQEYFIRHLDGRALSTESEKERVIKCLEAAIERRVCEGIRLELWADDRIGLLSDITRVLRENGLAVVRADVATQGEKAVNALYVKDLSGNGVDMEFVESMKKEMGPIALQVTNETKGSISPERSSLSFGNMLKSKIGRFSNTFITINQ